MSKKNSIRLYISLMRPGYWFKNIFMVIGACLALLINYAFNPEKIVQYLPSIFWGLVALCLSASANYVINEYLDRHGDAVHPKKKDRRLVAHAVPASKILMFYVALVAISLLISQNLINGIFSIFLLALLVSGFLYNVKPFRFKDVAYLDVVFESLNNPIRLMLGWCAVSATSIPPLTLILSYWLGGAFLMSMKRFSEFRSIGDVSVAASYRKSFKTYTEDKLLSISFTYAISCAFFLGIFLFKYKAEFLLLYPFIALLFGVYLKIALQKDSLAQDPDKIYRKPDLMLVLLLNIIGFLILLGIQLPKLTDLLINARPH